MDAPKITMGRNSATLREPSPLLALSLGRTREQLDASGDGEILALGAAALFACWPDDRAWPAKLRPNLCLSTRNRYCSIC